MYKCLQNRTLKNKTLFEKQIELLLFKTRKIQRQDAHRKCFGQKSSLHSRTWTAPLTNLPLCSQSLIYCIRIRLGGSCFNYLLFLRVVGLGVFLRNSYTPLTTTFFIFLRGTLFLRSSSSVSLNFRINQQLYRYKYTLSILGSFHSS